MKAWNWALALFAVLALAVDAGAQALPFSYAPSAGPQVSPWQQVSYPQPTSSSDRPKPMAMSPSRVFDNPPPSELDMPYITPQSSVIRTAYASPWSSWTTEIDPEASCAPASRPECGDPACNVCAPDTTCRTLGRFYFRAEAFALRRSHPPAQPVAFDITTSAILLDAKNLNFPMSLGQRFVAGYNFNEAFAVEALFFENQNWKAAQLATGTNSLFLSGDPATTISNLSANSNDYNGASEMSLINNTSLRNFELNFMRATTFSRFTVLGGYRYLDLHDKLALESTFVDAFGGRSTSPYVIDARSRLHGGQFGLIFRQPIDLFTFEVVSKAGVYDNFSAQSQVVYDQNSTTTLRNVLRQTKQAVAFVGEIGMNGIWKFNENLLGRFGYNVLWIDHVALAPNQLDFTDTAGSGQGVINKHGNLFLHGVNAGLEVQW